MHVDVERRPGSEVALTITVEPSVVEEQMEKLFQKYARRVNVPGFRPGKAPRQLVEARVERSALLKDAIEGVIDTTYKEALRENKLEPLVQGEIEDIDTADDLTVTYKVIVSVRPEISLPDLKELTVDYAATRVNDEQVDAEIERVREHSTEFTEVTEDGIQQGDLVTIDYTMKVNSEPYPEGDMTGYPLEVGSDTFFPELNEALIGLKLGETKPIEHDYAEEYSNKDLAGKKAEFDVVVQQVRRQMKPEVTDEWASIVTGGQITTVTELRERIQQNLQELAQRMDRDQIREELLRQLVSKSELDVPAVMVEEEYEHLMQDLESRLAREHMSFEDYSERIDRSIADIQSEQRILARDVVRRSLVLQEVARRDDVSVTDEDINSLLIMESYQRGERDIQQVRKQMKTLRKEMEKSGRLDHMVSRLFQEKILSHLEQHANVHITGLPEPAEEPAPAEGGAAEESTTEDAG